MKRCIAFEDEKIYSFRTRLFYESYSTHFKSLLIVTLIHRIIYKNLLNIRLFIVAILVIK